MRRAGFCGGKQEVPLASAASALAGCASAILLLVSRSRADPLDAADGALNVTVRGSSAGGFASRVSTDTAAREPVDAVSLLAEVPSVHVRRLGGDGSFGTLSVRGSASTEVAIVLAGIPLTSAADPSIDVGALPLWPGATYRVYRG